MRHTIAVCFRIRCHRCIADAKSMRSMGINMTFKHNLMLLKSIQQMYRVLYRYHVICSRCKHKARTGVFIHCCNNIRRCLLINLGTISFNNRITQNRRIWTLPAHCCCTCCQMSSGGEPDYHDLIRQDFPLICSLLNQSHGLLIII